MNNLAQVDIGTTYGVPWGQSLGFGALVSVIMNNFIIIASITMLFIIVAGGIMIIKGAGDNSPQSVAQGKAAVTAAVIGFVVVFAAYWIIQIVESVTGVPITNAPF